MLLLTIFTGASAGVAFAVAYAAVCGDLSALAASFLEVLLSYILQTPVSLSRIYVDLRRRRIVVESLLVSNPESFTHTPYLASIRKLQFAPDLSAWIRNPCTLELRELLIEGAHVFIERRDGKVNALPVLSCTLLNDLISRIAEQEAEQAGEKKKKNEEDVGASTSPPETADMRSTSGSQASEQQQASNKKRRGSHKSQGEGNQGRNCSGEDDFVFVDERDAPESAAAKDSSCANEQAQAHARRKWLRVQRVCVRQIEAEIYTSETPSSNDQLHSASVTTTITQQVKVLQTVAKNGSKTTCKFSGSLRLDEVDVSPKSAKEGDVWVNARNELLFALANQNSDNVAAIDAMIDAIVLSPHTAQLWKSEMHRLCTPLSDPIVEQESEMEDEEIDGVVFVK